MKYKSLTVHEQTSIPFQTRALDVELTTVFLSGVNIMRVAAFIVLKSAGTFYKKIIERFQFWIMTNSLIATVWSKEYWKNSMILNNKKKLWTNVQEKDVGSWNQCHYIPLCRFDESKVLESPHKSITVEDDVVWTLKWLAD